MGFDININLYLIENGIAKFVRTSDTCYLSFNWSRLSHICPKHFFEGEGKCPNDKCKKEYIKLWYFRDDCHNRRGDDIKTRAEKALKVLGDYGISIEQVDFSKDVAWGNDLNPRGRLAAFAYQIDNFRKLGEKYGDHFFLGDCDFDNNNLTMPDGTLIEKFNPNSDEDEDDDSYEIEMQDRIVTYYRHPFKGTFRVDSFKSAMEIYGLLAARSSPDADKWYKLALQMHDAPLKT
jgi:hypothetical protein